MSIKAQLLLLILNVLRLGAFGFSMLKTFSLIFPRLTEEERKKEKKLFVISSVFYVILFTISLILA